MGVSRQALIILAFTGWALSAGAADVKVTKPKPAKGDAGYRCFGAPFKDSLSPEITEMRATLPHVPELAAFLQFFKGRQKFAQDFFCGERYLGRCTLVDDGGSFQIVKYDGRTLVLEFLGIPRLVDKEGELTPWVEPVKKPLPKPIRVELQARPASDCTISN